jgi:hypothetical protein
MANDNNKYIKELNRAFSRGQLTLYLGAGVSQASGLPGWEELIISLYYQTINDDELQYSFRPFPNYVYAIAEWRLQKSKEPLDVIVRRCKAMYNDDRHIFLKNLKIMLYKSIGLEEYNFDTFTINQNDRNNLLSKNSTLQAIIDSCKKSVPGNKGIESVITYNYDNLLEIGLKGSDAFAPVWKQGQGAGIQLPIYHVHGYIPIEKEDINEEDIILSEQQYNMMSQNAYYWGNIIQMNRLSTQTGLMIGVSLTDKNMRRILDAVKTTPHQNNNYIILKEPAAVELKEDSEEIRKISEKAKEYKNRFVGGNIKSDEKALGQIIHILEKINEFDKDVYKNDFNELGLKVIWIADFKEIPEILRSLRIFFLIGIISSCSTQ